MDFLTGFDADSPYLQNCDMPEEAFTIEPFTMVIFGGAGDLSTRKLLPTLAHLYREEELPGDFAVVGVGMPTLGNEAYRALGREAVGEAKPGFSAHLHYVSGPFDEGATYAALGERLAALGGADRQVIYYLAVPPAVTPVIVAALREHGLQSAGRRTRVIVEKPFGRDRESAVALNRSLLDVFEERQIYRIDHYLGKETVQNIIFFRFSNTIFERLWNSQYIDHVQITVAESIGIEHRGAFYEQAGVVRDIVQNHIMQLIALVAMEPPIGLEADFVRDEKVKIFRSIRPLAGEEIDRQAVRGQYGPGEAGGAPAAGYREEAAVASDSGTPTFMAARFAIANWRWAGVPFYVRTGKRLPRRVTEIVVQFRQPPLRLFGRACDALEPNLLVLTIQPEERIVMRYGVKYPRAANKIYTVNSAFSYGETFREEAHPAYERLLVDCMKGDLTLFVRQDGVEAMWQVVDPVIARWEERPAPDFPNYAAGTWGPPEAAALLARDGRRWHTG